MIKYFILFISMAAIVAFTSCGGKSGSGEAAKEETQEEAGGGHVNENMATLSSEQMKTIGIELGTIDDVQACAL